MSKLTIVRGVSGSGKSTWARAQANALVVSRDDLRASLFGSADQDYYACDKAVLRRKEGVVTEVQNQSIAAGLAAGLHVIVDNTNTHMKFVNEIAALGYKAGAEVEVKVIDVPLETAIKRNKMRGEMGGRNVPEKVIREQHGALQQSKNASLRLPDAPPEKYNGTPGKPKAFLVDIDGTLAHMRDYRKPYDWHKVGLDDVDEVIAGIVTNLKHAYDVFYEYSLNPLDRGYVIVMSGRDESCRAETEKWLRQVGIEYDHLFMRPEKDMRKDSIIKEELFNQYVRDEFDVQFVLDDRQQVVDMWRAKGMTCLQVAEGAF